MERHLHGWARICNDGKLRWPGPDGLSNPGEDVGGYKPEDVRSWMIVEKGLQDMRKAGISPDIMRLLLMHLYYKGESLVTFRVPIGVLDGQLKQVLAQVREIDRANPQEAVRNAS